MLNVKKPLGKYQFVLKRAENSPYSRPMKKTYFLDHWSICHCHCGSWLLAKSLFNAPIGVFFQNSHFQWRGPLKPGPEVVITAIDEKSIDELGRWIWSRKTIAQLVERLVPQQVKVIGFDIVVA